jgi:hypothetical protein
VITVVFELDLLSFAKSHERIPRKISLVALAHSEKGFVGGPIPGRFRGKTKKER